MHHVCRSLKLCLDPCTEHLYLRPKLQQSALHNFCFKLSNECSLAETCKGRQNGRMHCSEQLASVCVCFFLVSFSFFLKAKMQIWDSGVSGGKSKKENKYKAPWRNGVFLSCLFSYILQIILAIFDFPMSAYLSRRHGKYVRSPIPWHRLANRFFWLVSRNHEF